MADGASATELSEAEHSRVALELAENREPRRGPKPMKSMIVTLLIVLPSAAAAERWTVNATCVGMGTCNCQARLAPNFAAVLACQTLGEGDRIDYHPPDPRAGCLHP